MTRAFNVGTNTAWSDAPEYSWATGDNPAVNSDYRRLSRLNGRVREFNVAKTGSTMADLQRQLREAAAFKVDYVSILMGANDLLRMMRRTGGRCTVVPSGMTPVATFTAEFRAALEAFTTLRPSARIMVVSIPNVPRLWSLFGDDVAVQAVWQRNGGCTAPASDPRNDAARAIAARRIVAYNAALARVCRAFARCRWDGGATYRYPFAKTDFSPVDYFHPNVNGQRRIAEIVWRAGYWSGAA